VTTMTAPHTDDASEPGRSLIKENQPWFVDHPQRRRVRPFADEQVMWRALTQRPRPRAADKLGGQPSSAALIQPATFERMGRDRTLCCISRRRGGQR
jgi:hypothetical protein